MKEVVRKFGGFWIINTASALWLRIELMAAGSSGQLVYLLCNKLSDLRPKRRAHFRWDTSPTARDVRNLPLLFDAETFACHLRRAKEPGLLCL